MCTVPAARQPGVTRSGGCLKRSLDFIWPLIGFLAVVVSLWLLSKEFRGEAVASQVWEQLGDISFDHYALSILSALLAYAALAWYDRIALMHLGIRNISWPFIAVCSFTTYALSHTIGFSVFSGAMVRYRAYSTKGLSAAQVAVLVAITSITFTLGSLLLGGLVLVFEPTELRRVANFLPHFLTDVRMAQLLGIAFLAVVIVYVVGSLKRLAPLKIAGFRIEYPRPEITVQQFVAAPLELIGAAGIIYFALPEAGNPGFFVVLAVFLGSFSVAVASNAPAGAGVFDLLFINALPTIPKAKVLAAVLMFRLFYFLIPLAFAILVVVLFERGRFTSAKTVSNAEPTPEPPREMT